MEFRAYESEVATDFRRFYGLSAYQAGEGYSVAEALSLLNGLNYNTESLYFMKKAEWTFPVSREYIALAHLINITTQANTDPKHASKIKPYLVPFDTDDNTVARGELISIEEALEVYKPVVNTLTPDEIREQNRIFMENSKKVD